MSFALKKIVFSVTMACFVLAGQGVASAKTAAKDPVVHAIAKAKGKKVQKPAAKKKVVSRAKATGRRVHRQLAPSGVVKASIPRQAAPVVIPEDQKLAQQLRQAPSPANLNLTAASAFMFNQDNGRVLFEKNADAQLPVASLTKLMSALVIMRANLPMNEAFTVQSEDYHLPFLFLAPPYWDDLYARRSASHRSYRI